MDEEIYSEPGTPEERSQDEVQKLGKNAREVKSAKHFSYALFHSPSPTAIGGRRHLQDYGSQGDGCMLTTIPDASGTVMTSFRNEGLWHPLIGLSRI